MEKGEKHTCKARLIGCESGQTVRTAQYGAQYIFQTDKNERLYWDTLSNNAAFVIGSECTIAFTIQDTRKEVFWLGETEYHVKNVRIQK